MIEVLGWIGFFFSILGVFFNARKKIKCWHFYSIGSLFFLFIALYRWDLPQVILWIVFLISNYYAYYQWRKE